MLEFDVKKYKSNRKIIIYGAGVYGEICLRCLQKNGIEPYAFADRRSDLEEYLGVKVISIDEIEKYKEDIFLLATISYMKAALDLLRKEGIKKYFSIANLLECDIDLSILSEYAKGSRKKKNEYKQALQGLAENKLIINNIDLVVTQYCNLRCKDCGSLMPYYKKPNHFDYNSIIWSFDRFLDKVDYVNELRILGGETFLYPNLPEIVNHYASDKRIEKIYIYTNGVMPFKDEDLKRICTKKTYIRLSDYGVLSKNKDTLINLCRKYEIAYEVLDSGEWRDMGGIEKRDYSKEKLEEVFKKCENAKCPSFCDGKLYICPRAAHMEKLGFFCNDASEVIDFTGDVNDISKADIEDFLYARSSFEACYYCNGNNRWENAIPAAIQKEK